MIMVIMGIYWVYNGYIVLMGISQINNRYISKLYIANKFPIIIQHIGHTIPYFVGFSPFFPPHGNGLYRMVYHQLIIYGVVLPS